MVRAITLFVLLVSAFTLVGQGIQVSFGYPNDSCFRRLTIEDIDSNSPLGMSKFTGTDAYYKFRDMGLWNQPAAYRTNGSTETNFNYFDAFRCRQDADCSYVRCAAFDQIIKGSY